MGVDAGGGDCSEKVMVEGAEVEEGIVSEKVMVDGS